MGSATAGTAVLLVVFGVMAISASAQEPDTPSRAELLAELGQVQTSASGAFESAVIRGWGTMEVFRPLWNIRAELSRQDAQGELSAEQVAGAVGRVNRVLASFAETLHLAPAGEVTWSPPGVPVVAGPIELPLTVGVPGALVLRVRPGGSGGQLKASAAESPGVTVEPRSIKLPRYYDSYLVVPIVAGGQPGKRSVRITLAGSAGSAELNLALDVRPAGAIRGRITRKDSGKPVAAKLFVEDSAGRLYVVADAPNYTTQEWYAPWQPRFSYVEGEFTLAVPPGEYRVTAMKGFGYRSFTTEVIVEDGKSADVAVAMEPLIDLEAQGWLSADMHTHARTIPLAMLRAEDVNVATRTFYSSERPYRLSVDRSNSDPLHLSAQNQEIEHWNFGNAFYFNIPTSALDPDQGKREMTPMFHYDQQVHEMGGITIRWLRGRPFAVEGNGQQQPEIAVDAALGHMDAWGVLENSMLELLNRPGQRWTGSGWGGRLYDLTYGTWYALLNCGIRMPIAAGTSYGRLSRLGFNRVYARVAGPLTEQSWADALVRGDGFVSNGPLLWLRVNGKLPGQTVELTSPGKVTVSVRLLSEAPVRLVEILRNGEVIAAKRDKDGLADLTFEVPVDVDRPCWLAARCFGEQEVRYPHTASPNLFAHTNAAFVTVAGKKPSSPGDAERFLKEIDALIEFVPKLPTETMQQRAMEQFRKAREYYAAQVAPEP